MGRWRYDTKVWVCAGGIILIVAVSVLGVWTYNALTEIERSKLVDYLQVKTLEEDIVPAHHVVDNDAAQCREQLGVR